LSETVENTRQIKEAKRNHEASLVALQEFLESADNEVFKIVQEQEKLQGDAAGEELVLFFYRSYSHSPVHPFTHSCAVEEDKFTRNNMEEVSMLLNKKKNLDHVVVETRKKIELLHNKHNSELESISREHEGELVEIERRVKRELGEKDKLIEGIVSTIEQHQMKIEHAKKLLAGYKAGAKKNTMVV